MNKPSYSEFLKRQNALEALIEMLLVLEILRKRHTRFGDLSPIGRDDIHHFLERQLKVKYGP